MSYIGSGRNLAALVGSLTPEALPRLVRDILASLGHKGISITDGPGDGCRDIHSTTADNERMLSQCKCHRDIEQTVTSKEVAELAMGLVKFGYKRGLFVTTSRISPQAKRELLDSYPGLRLEFLDGEELLAKVLDDVALAGLWFDGERLVLVNSAVSIPVIVRRHKGDLPIPLPHSIRPAEGLLCIAGVNGSIDVKFDAREPVTRFESYRAPTYVSMVEGMLVELVCAELVVRGSQSLNEISSAMRSIGQWLAVCVARDEQQFSVRLGRPALTPLGGATAGARINLEIEPVTFVGAAGVVTDEMTWLMPSGSSEWTEKSRARVSQMNAVRLYNAHLDACLAFELTTPADYRNRGMLLNKSKLKKRGWERSLFVMHDAKLDISQIGTDPPDEKLDWSPELRMYAWFHRSLQGGWRIEPMRHQQLAAVAEQMREEDVTEAERLAAIQLAQLNAGGKKVHPRIARHMVGLLKWDPLHSSDRMTVTIADLISGAGVPSPVDPESREFRATMCWKVDRVLDDESLVRIAQVNAQCHVLEVWSEQLRNGDCYAILHFDDFGALSPSASTDAHLCHISGALSSTAINVDEYLAQYGGRRATADYWMAKFCIDCRGLLPEPSLDNLKDLAGPPEINTYQYLALMQKLPGTNF